MAQDMDFSTTYIYQPLESYRHVRLLEVISNIDDGVIGTPKATYRLIHVELPSDDTSLDFEAVSYTWGDGTRVSGLQFEGIPGHIGLTANLTEALPHLAHHSITRRLWIDQICINQSDNDERSAQIGLMSEIYKKTTRTIIWLGPSDESSRLCKDWLDTINNLFVPPEDWETVIPGNEKYNPDTRNSFISETFTNSVTTSSVASAIGRFWARTWFRRGWIVQEFLLPKEIVCLTGDVRFGLQDLLDLNNVPDDVLREATNCRTGCKVLIRLKTHPYTDAQPLRFLRLMVATAQEFITQELSDQLYAFLGLIEGTNFRPDYNSPLRENFTRFANAIAHDFGSLDFLSLWSASIDNLVNDTPAELRGFPSWVPSFSARPLRAPMRLAVGGARSYRYNVMWKASAGRRHVFQACKVGQLQVCGHIIDSVDTISSKTSVTRYWDVDKTYLTGLVEQIKRDLPGLDDWTIVDFVQFLNLVSSNGNEPQNTTEQLLGVAPNNIPDLMRDSLGLCLVMAAGRRFAKTENGRIGLVPLIGSQARSEDKKGSVIAVVHGCSVPVVLHPIDEKPVGGELPKYRLVGDCYIEGIMQGEAVNWKESEAQTFVLE